MIYTATSCVYFLNLVISIFGAMSILCNVNFLMEHFSTIRGSLRDENKFEICITILKIGINVLT